MSNENENARTSASDVILEICSIITNPVKMICEYLKLPLEIANANLLDKDRIASKTKIQEQEKMSEIARKETIANLKITEKIEKYNLKNQKESLNTYKKYQEDLAECTEKMITTLMEIPVKSIKTYHELLESVIKSLNERSVQVQEYAIRYAKELEKLTDEEARKQLMAVNQKYTDNFCVFITNTLRDVNEEINKNVALTRKLMDENVKTIKDILSPIVLKNYQPAALLPHPSETEVIETTCEEVYP